MTMPVNTTAVLDRAVPCGTPTDARAVAAIDRTIRRNAWRLALYSVLLLAFLTSGIYQYGAGKIPLVASVLAALALLITLPSAVIAAWVRPGSFASRPARKLLGIIVLSVAGGFVGAWFAEPGDWSAFMTTLRDRAPTVVFATALLGLVMGGLATGLGILRQRENLAVAARVRAESEASLREERMAHALAEARLAALQAQVEPHFLFNSLAAIVELAEGRAPEAAELCQSLVQFLRGTLSGLRADGTTLGEDLDLATAYLEVMAIRLGDRLRWTIDVSPGLRAAPLPAAMAISLVENAIRHGIEPSASPAAIVIAARRSDTHLVITVEDTGVGFREPVVEGLGLANIRERLRLQFGDAADLTLEASRPHGTRAVLRLPLVESTT